MKPSTASKSEPTKGPMKGIPVFCVKAFEYTTKRDFYINIMASDIVKSPEDDINENILFEVQKRRHCDKIGFHVPLLTSPIFWAKESMHVKKDSYVVDVMINDGFAFKKVLGSEAISSYVAIVTMNVLEQKYNDPKATKATCGQFLNHELDLDEIMYKILPKNVERTDDIVNHKITLLGAPCTSSRSATTGDDNKNYNIYYRPGSEILTISIETNKCPKSVSFNDDRVIIESEDEKIKTLDLCLPIFIDLKEPVKYKYDAKYETFRIVMRTNEQQNF